MRATMPLHPPASVNPMMGINSAPNQIRKNCRTSLKIAENNPPAATYTPTVNDETMMLKWRFQPRTTSITTAIAYMLTPDIRMVMNANVTALKALASLPYRSFRYPGTEWVLEM